MQMNCKAPSRPKPKVGLLRKSLCYVIESHQFSTVGLLRRDSSEWDVWSVPDVLEFQAGESSLSDVITNLFWHSSCTNLEEKNNNLQNN